MKPKIKIIYSLKDFNGEVAAFEEKIDKAMESIGYTSYSCGYNTDTQERDLSYDINCVGNRMSSDGAFLVEVDEKGKEVIG